jgi:Domain of unknown function (DUF4267)
MRTSDRIVLGLAIAAGAALVVIGIRFHFWPEAAAKFFGVGARPAGTELYTAVALRDVWLGALALGLAAWREWRALALWCGLGALVCWGDAALVVSAGGKLPAVAFHTISGVVCAAVAVACWGRRG